ETFTITLSSPTGGAALGPQPTTTLNILDDDSVFAFDAPALSVNEAGPNVTLNVTRTGSLNTAATVMFAAAPHIPVVNDAIVQGPQTFSVNLSSPTGGGQLGSPAGSTITIVSDDNGV